jgi:uncharacterized protein Yka (UPF0111/DUF47 family)
MRDWLEYDSELSPLALRIIQDLREQLKQSEQSVQDLRNENKWLRLRASLGKSLLVVKSDQVKALTERVLDLEEECDDLNEELRWL